MVNYNTLGDNLCVDVLNLFRQPFIYPSIVYHNSIDSALIYSKFEFISIVNCQLICVLRDK